MHLENEVSKYDESGMTQRKGQEEKELFARLSRKRWCIAYGVLKKNEWKTLRKGVLHRACEGVYFGIQRRRMRQRIG